MEYQLRQYRIPRGSHGCVRRCVAARRRWRVEGADEFVWIIGYDGPEGFAAADDNYYASLERKRMSPDPAAFIEAPSSKMMRSVLPSTSVGRSRSVRSRTRAR